MNTKTLILIPLFAIVFTMNAIAFVEENPLNEDTQQKLNNTDKQFFIENKGQWSSEVLYLIQMNGLNTWITTKGMLYEFYKIEEIKNETSSNEVLNKFEDIEYTRWGQRVGYKLIENNLIVNTQGKQKQEGYYNYLIGNDLTKHASNVGLYKEALVKEIYTGIDIRYYFDKGTLRYDYVVHPEADPNQILFNIEGSNKTYLNEKGELVFTTCFGEVKNTDLYCYQQQDKKNVPAQFIKRGENWSIDLTEYDKTQTLIIDPLIYSTYIGGNNRDAGYSITLDTLNNAYITGYTYSLNYDTTTGVFQTTYGGGTYDAFVTKLNATGTALIYSTYIGGSYNDFGNSIALDSSNNVYITGVTGSLNFPVTSGAYQTTYSGGSSDVFVIKLNQTGTVLNYSTYIGGNGYDSGNAIALDTYSNAYITGETMSAYPVTSGAYQTTFGGGYSDVFVTKFNPSGSALIYSTYIGGNDRDVGNSITLDASNNAYITGFSQSTNYPVTSGAFQTTYGGGLCDGFITKLNSTSTVIEYSTLIGGGNWDFGTSIALDTLNNAYITGYTTSFDYPVTLGSSQTTFGGVRDAFVSKINTIGSVLVYSTYIGGYGYDWGYSIAVDPTDNAYITGHTSSPNFPVTSGAYQTTLAGANDAFVTKLNSNGSLLTYSTYIGGNGGSSSGKSITLNTSNNVYITGFTYTPNFPVTMGAYQTIFEDSTDCFVTKIKLDSCFQTTSMDTIITCDSITWINGNTYYSSTNTPSLIFTNSMGCDSVVTLNLTINNSTSGTDLITACDSITWIDGNTYTTSTNTPTFILTNAANCDSIVTLDLTVNNIDNTITDSSPTLTANQSNALYQWLDCDNGNITIPSESNQDFTASISGNYAVEITIGSCIDTSDCEIVIVTGVTNNIGELEIHTYPNPTSTQLTIDTQLEIQEIIITDLTGKTIKSLTPKSNTINVEELSNGIYFIKVVSGEETIIQKFIKN